MQAKQRILLVENEQDIADVFKRGIEKFGYKITAFLDPVRALLEYRSDLYDLAILDIRMPALNGIDLAKRLLQQNASLPILFWSAYDYDEKRIKELIPDFKGLFLHKPCGVGEVIKVLEKFAKPSAE